MKTPMAYCAGPYRARTIFGRAINIIRAWRVARALWRKGYAVFCPHANSAMMDGAAPDKVFLEYGLKMVRMCDLFVFTRSDAYRISEGSDAEWTLAIRLFIPSYPNPEAVPTAKQFMNDRGYR